MSQNVKSMLHHKIVLLKTLMIILSIGISIMSFIRYQQGAMSQAIADALFVIILLFSFYKLKNNPSTFKIVARIVLFFAFALSIFLITTQHEADSRLLWFTSTLFLLFYLLDKDEGWIWFFVITIGIILLYIFNESLIGLEFPEFIVLIFNMFLVVMIVTWYEKIKDSSEQQLLLSKRNLEKEVELKTAELRELNENLEKRIKEEITKNTKAQQQMLQQSRLAQMGEMISMIAHQWRQPLGAIASTSADLRMKIILDKFDVLNDPKEYEKLKNYFNKQLNQIEAYVQTLTTTIDDFRNFYKPNKLTKTLYVKEPILKALNIIQESIKSSGIKIKQEYNSTKKVTVFDSELTQVFLNILKNAQDNFKEKSIKNPYIMIRTSDEDGIVKIEFSDNGGGIKDEIAEKIFDPYFSTKDEKNGTGLGLYMSKTIIEEHHKGKLYIKNKNGGVSFIIELPVTT